MTPIVDAARRKDEDPVMASLWIHAFRAGRLERSVALARPETTVGSRAFCDLPLGGEGIDPLHAKLVRHGDEVELVLERSGQARPLIPGDPVHLGGWSLTLEVRPDPAPPLRLGDVLDLLPRLWNESEDTRPAQALLETLTGVFSADFGAFLELDGDTPRVVHRAGPRPASSAETISMTVVQQVARERAPVVVADVRTDPSLSQAHSIPVHVRTVIAAPLSTGQKISGILYLESPESGRLYNEEERDLLGRICALAGEHMEHAASTRELEQANLRLGALHRSASSAASLADLVGSGSAMRKVVEQIRQVAKTGTTTLILGESGTGKELVGKAIHQMSARRDAPFVAVNCMALPEDLVESELFGHVRGAFSGATADRLGRFEMAHHGSLFLDEVGEVSLRVQVKLLRVLQERVIQRLGEGRERPVDVRLIAATNAPLVDAVSRGSFRDDLFYRLSVFVIQLPPLRDRLEDLPLLVDHFIRTFNHSFRRRVRGLDPRALDLLARHHWPGNVRELRNVIEAAFVRETTDWITAESLSLVPASPPLRGRENEPEWPDGLEAARASFERRHIVRMLEAERGSVPATVKRLSISRSNFYKKCAALGIDPERYRR